MKKINMFFLLCTSLYSLSGNCMLDRYSQHQVDGNYDYSIGSYKAMPYDFIVTNRTTGEKFKLKGYEGNITSLLIKPTFVICATTGTTHNRSRIYMWDLKKKFRCCGLCQFLNDKIGLDLNYIVGLNPVKKAECKARVKTMFFEEYMRGN